MATSHNNGPGSYVVYPNQKNTGMHTEREITSYTDGFSWTCGDCGTIDERRYAKWDDVIFGYQIHQYEARITALETKLAAFNAAWESAGLDEYLNAETATTRATVSGASTTGRKPTL